MRAFTAASTRQRLTASPPSSVHTENIALTAPPSANACLSVSAFHSIHRPPCAASMAVSIQTLQPRPTRSNAISIRPTQAPASSSVG